MSEYSQWRSRRGGGTGGYRAGQAIVPGWGGYGRGGKEREDREEIRTETKGKEESVSRKRKRRRGKAGEEMRESNGVCKAKGGRGQVAF